jgi:hypothetical protein
LIELLAGEFVGDLQLAMSGFAGRDLQSFHGDMFAQRVPALGTPHQIHPAAQVPAWHRRTTRLLEDRSVSMDR